MNEPMSPQRVRELSAKLHRQWVVATERRRLNECPHKPRFADVPCAECERCGWTSCLHANLTE